jgi:flagellar basal-body rod protein FlgB
MKRNGTYLSYWLVEGGTTMSDKQIDFLESIMDISTLKRKTNADNIANYNTPDFKATVVEFDNLFVRGEANNVSTSNERHISTFDGDEEPSLVKDTTTQDRYDGNNVDLNKEMVDMIKNNYMYTMSVQAINKQFMLNKIAMQ